jgi:hypothetical protein
MSTYKVSKLEGALLDLAVCQVGRLWEMAHLYFQTMTLDPTFNGAKIVELERGYLERKMVAVCMLQPRNPFRQDPQEFSPSTQWCFGGPLIESERINVFPRVADAGWSAQKFVDQFGAMPTYGYGGTALIAAMRCFVASKVIGNEVELP